MSIVSVLAYDMTRNRFAGSRILETNGEPLNDVSEQYHEDDKHAQKPCVKIIATGVGFNFDEQAHIINICMVSEANLPNHQVGLVWYCTR